MGRSRPGGRMARSRSTEPGCAPSSSRAAPSARTRCPPARHLPPACPRRTRWPAKAGPAAPRRTAAPPRTPRGGSRRAEIDALARTSMVNAEPMFGAVTGPWLDRDPPQGEPPLQLLLDRQLAGELGLQDKLALVVALLVAAGGDERVERASLVVVDPVEPVL